MHFVDFLRVRHIQEHVHMAIFEEIGDILERELIILWDLDVTHVPALDI